jgi:hypothetical protein
MIAFPSNAYKTVSLKSACRILNRKCVKTASTTCLNAGASRNHQMWGGCIGRRNLVQDAGGAHVLISLADWSDPKGRFSATLDGEPEAAVTLA